MDPLVSLRKRFVGTFLHDRRVKAGLSQVDVSKSLGWSTAQFVSNIERGIALPPFRTIPMIAKLLRITEKEFVAAIGKFETAALELRMKEIRSSFKTVRK